MISGDGSSTTLAVVPTCDIRSMEPQAGAPVYSIKVSVREKEKEKPNDYRIIDDHTTLPMNHYSGCGAPNNNSALQHQQQQQRRVGRCRNFAEMVARYLCELLSLK
jgi:hypothetical protein